MTQTISANALLIWFIWGIFMGFGWTLGSWAMSKLLTAIGG